MGCPAKYSRLFSERPVAQFVHVAFGQMVPLPTAGDNPGGVTHRYCC